MKLNLIIEELKDKVRNFVGDTYPIFKNPTREELISMEDYSSKHNKGYYRIILDLKKKDAYFSPADVFHSQMATKLGLPDNYPRHEPVFIEDYLYIGGQKGIGKIIFSSMDSLSDFASGKRSVSERKELSNKFGKLLEKIEKEKSFINKWIDYIALREHVLKLKSKQDLIIKPYIKEEFDEPVKATENMNTRKYTQYSFEIEGREYSLRFIKGKMAKYSYIEVQFALKKTIKGKEHFLIKATGTGHVKKVFSTVIDRVLDFVRLNKTDYIIFGADNKEPSRVRLYSSIVFSKEAKEKLPGYIPSKETFQDRTAFVIKKRGLPDFGELVNNKFAYK